MVRRDNNSQSISARDYKFTGTARHTGYRGVGPQLFGHVCSNILDSQHNDTRSFAFLSFDILLLQILSNDRWCVGRKARRRAASPRRCFVIGRVPQHLCSDAARAEDRAACVLTPCRTLVGFGYGVLRPDVRSQVPEDDNRDSKIQNGQDVVNGAEEVVRCRRFRPHLSVYVGIQNRNDDQQHYPR